MKTFKEAFLPEKKINLARGDGEREWKQIEVTDGVVQKSGKGSVNI